MRDFQFISVCVEVRKWFQRIFHEKLMLWKPNQDITHGFWSCWSAPPPPPTYLWMTFTSKCRRAAGLIKHLWGHFLKFLKIFDKKNTDTDKNSDPEHRKNWFLQLQAVGYCLLGESYPKFCSNASESVFAQIRNTVFNITTTTTLY